MKGVIKTDKDKIEMENAINVAAKKNIPIIKVYMKKHKGTLKVLMVIALFVFIWLKIGLKTNMTASVIISLLVYLIEFIMFCVFGVMTYTGTSYDNDSGVEVVKDSFECGSAERGGEEEREETFSHGTYATNKENFLGEQIRKGKMGYIQKDTDLFSMIEGFGINGNRIFFGSPGSGKSAALLLNDIFQTIRRGESMVVSDTKGELYNLTSVVARAYGYVTKILNLDPDFLVHSDACDPFKVIVEDQNLAPSFAETICANISDEVGFWADEQMNILTFFLLYVAGNDQGIPKTLPGMFQLLNKSTVEDIDDLGCMLSEDHPAKVYYNNFASADKTVKGNALGGLQVKLSKLGQPIMQKLFGTDEIDFKLPATQKCIYYVNLAANNRSNSYFSALFFDTLMSELESVARKSGGRCPIKIKLYMDEYYNLGIIPNMDNRLGTLRSAGIDIYLYLQSLGQLMQMYPEQQWEIVMECASMVCLLKTNTNTTAEYISKMCGVMTAKTRGIRRTKTKGTLGLGFEVMENISNTQRNVYFPDELRRMDNKELLVIPSGHNPFRFRKVLYISHPMMKLVRPVQSQEHIPDWVSELDPSDYEKYGIYEDTPFDNGEYLWDQFVKPLDEKTDFDEPWSEDKEKMLQKEIKREKRAIEKELEEYESDQPNDSENDANEFMDEPAEDEDDANQEDNIKDEISPEDDYEEYGENEYSDDDLSDEDLTDDDLSDDLSDDDLDEGNFDEDEDNDNNNQKKEEDALDDFFG